mmetsp:Transcript_23515/g.60501  ORF Transcript_23515/g.60501 Transcript_23515/m.60501 type:complete len:200 (-) Transcript_23515:117-716(-)
MQMQITTRLTPIASPSSSSRSPGAPDVELPRRRPPGPSSSSSSSSPASVPLVSAGGGGSAAALVSGWRSVRTTADARSRIALQRWVKTRCSCSSSTARSSASASSSSSSISCARATSGSIALEKLASSCRMRSPFCVELTSRASLRTRLLGSSCGLSKKSDGSADAPGSGARTAPAVDDIAPGALEPNDVAASDVVPSR